MTLNTAQYAQLLKPINKDRVKADGKGFAHLEAYDIRAHLIRIFGFGEWSAETDKMELLFEREGTNSKGSPAVTVAYRAHVILRIHATGAVYSEWAVGDAPNFPVHGVADAHDFAVKKAESQAFKRCAVNLGDQYGLSLYRKGSLAPVVIASLITIDKDAVPADLPPAPAVDPVDETPDGLLLGGHSDSPDGEVEPHVAPSPSGTPSAEEQAKALLMEASDIAASDLSGTRKAAEFTRLTGAASKLRLLNVEINKKSVKTHLSEFVSGAV